MKKILVSVLLACLASSAHAQTSVVPFQPGVSPAGITYFLPQTSLRFLVTATCTTHHAGPYAQYAERFLGIAGVPTTDVDEWTLDSIEAIAYGTPDTAEAYTVALNPKSDAPLVTLTPAGLLLAINADVDYPALLPEGKTWDVGVDNPVASDHFSEDYMRAGSVVKKAQIVAEEIYDIREKRSLIAGGEADFNPTDGKQLQLMLERQDKKELALKSLFLGTESKKSHRYILDFTPLSSVSDYLLFRFSKYLGMVDTDDLSGEPYYLRLTDTTVLPEPAPVAQSKKAPKVVNDVRYRIPGKANVQLSNTKGKIFEQNFNIAQFGRVEHLGGELFNKKFTTKVYFDAVTGNIRHIDMAPPTK